MDMFFFDKRIFTLYALDQMTKEQAEREFLHDMMGKVLWYTDMNEFATDFNNGCIKPDVFFVKIYE